MAFDVAAESYDRFMGRYSVQLSSQLADLAGISAGQRAIDVGSGPGALTAELVRRLGAGNVVAVDPSEPFVAAARERNPGVEVQLAPAEELPYEDGSFDAALAQLVAHFMGDPVAGLREMARVTKPGGVVAASVWDFAGGRAPLSPFWRAARKLREDTLDESGLAGARRDHLAELFEAAGLRELVQEEHTASLEYETFEDWWHPYTLGVGPAGAHTVSLSEEDRQALREQCRRDLPDAPFAVDAVAWAVRGVV